MFRIAVVAAVTAVLACAPGVHDAATTARRGYAIDSLPIVDIGGDADGPAALFSGTVMPALLSDGRIVVANGGSQELRVFDATGAWIRSIGRSGSGPGEFNDLGWFHVGTGDTLRAYDWGQLRVSVFSPDGTYQRGYMLGADGGGGTLRPHSALADGAIVASTQSSVDMRAAAGVRRDTALLLLFDAEGRLLDSLGRVPGSEAWIDRTETRVSVQNRPFGKQLTVRAHGTVVYVGAGDDHAVRVLTGNGSEPRLLQWSGSPVPLTPPIIDAYIAATVADAPPARRAAAIDLLRRAPLPRTLPAYATFVVADDGALWVGRYLPRGQGARQTFEVLDTTGATLGSVVMPARFTPSQITRDQVIGVWLDEEDATHIRVYRLIREP